MLVLLLPAALLALAVWCLRHPGLAHLPAVERVLLGALLWAALVCAATEALGAFGALAPLPVSLLWAAVAAAAGLAAWRAPGTVPLVEPPRWSVAAGAVLAVEAVTGLVSPPNNYDSMTYHLARVGHWIQQGSVAFYPTHILRQDWLTPGAEYLLLQVRLLSGSDRFLNLVQLAAHAGCVALVWTLALRLGARPWSAGAAALAAATLPVAVLQASSTQNDLVAGFFCLGFVLLASGEPDRARAAGAGLALGMAVLAKSTSLLACAPFAALALIRHLRSGWRGALRLAAPLVLAPALLAGPFALRNLRAFGHPAGPAFRRLLLTEHRDPGAVARNAVRHATLHLGTPWEGVNAVTRRVAGLLLGSRADEPGQVFPNQRFDTPRTILHEDSDGNTLHFLLLLALVPLALRKAPGHTACVVIAALLFCALLRWQPWMARLHTPLFLLALPLFGPALADRPRLSRALSAVLVAAAVPWLFANASRPLVGNPSIFQVPRPWLTFASRPAVARAYLGAAEVLRARGASRVGLVLAEDDYEYPLRLLLPGARLTHVNVTNESRGLPEEESGPPQALVATGPPRPIVTRWGPYLPAWQAAGLSVLLPETR